MPDRPPEDAPRTEGVTRRLSAQVLTFWREHPERQLAALILAFAKRGDDPSLLAALGLAAFGILPYQISIGDARYAMPLYPLLAFAAAVRAAPRSSRDWRSGRRIAAATAGVLHFANAVRDVRLTDPALRAISAAGGNRLRVPYHFAR